MIRKLLPIMAVGIIIAAAAAIYLYMKPTKNLEKVKPDFRVEAAHIFQEFSDSESLATEKYVGKVAEVTGPLASLSIGDKGAVLFLLDDLFGISCSMDSSYTVSVKEKLENLSAGDQITVRGRCNGMLTDVQFSSCVFVSE
jgi:hypothetical protein